MCTCRCVKVKLGKIVILLKIFANILATSDCFVNLCPIFPIFIILVNNDIVHMSHNLGCLGTHFGGNLCAIYIYIKWAGTVQIQGLHHCVIHHWSAEVFSILTRCVEL